MTYPIQRPGVTQSVVEGFGLRGQPTFDLAATVMPVAIVGGSPDQAHLGTVQLVDAYGKPIESEEGGVLEVDLVRDGKPLGTEDDPLWTKSDGGTPPEPEYATQAFGSGAGSTAISGNGQATSEVIMGSLGNPWPTDWEYYRVVGIQFGYTTPSAATQPPALSWVLGDGSHWLGSGLVNNTTTQTATPWRATLDTTIHRCHTWLNGAWNPIADTTFNLDHLVSGITTGRNLDVTIYFGGRWTELPSMRRAKHLRNHALAAAVAAGVTPYELDKARLRLLTDG